MSRVLVPLLVLALALFVASAVPTAPATAQEQATVDYYTIKYNENGQKLWDVTFDSKGWDEAMAVAVDSLGNIIVTGRSGNGGQFDYYTIKYDKDGNQLWSKSFNSGGDDQAYAVAADSNDNVIVTGGSQIQHVYHVANETVGTGNGTETNYTLQHHPIVNGPATIYLDGNLTTNYTIDNATGKITFDTPPEAGVAITADYHYQATNDDYYTIKYDPQGNELWNRTYDSGGDDRAMAVAVDSDGNVIVTGGSQIGHVYHVANETVGIGNGTEINFTLQHHPIVNGSATIYLDGNPTTNYNIDNATGKITFDTPPEAVNITADYDYEASNSDYCTIKYNGTDGSELWNRTYDGGSTDYANGVAVDSEDNIIVTGYSFDGTTLNYCTIKYDAAGNEVWNEPAIYDSLGHDQAQAIAVDKHDNIIVTGSSREIGAGTKWYLCTIKYHPNGTQFWVQPATYHGSYKGEPSNTIGQSVTADSKGDVIITGCYYVPAYIENNTYHLAEYNCYITIKYDKDGNMLPGWPVIYDSGVYDCSHGVAVDSDDNIIVTGGSQRSPEASVGGGGGLSSAAIAGIAVGATAGTGALAFLIRRGWGKGEPAPRAERRREARKGAKKGRKSKR